MKTTIKVAAIIFNEKGEILLIKERYETGGKIKWNLVKGTYDDAKETLVGCIKREIKEEVGLTAKDAVLKKIYHYGDADNPRVLFIFFVNKFEGKISLPASADQNMRNEDITSTYWINKDDLKNIPKNDFVASYIYSALKDLNRNKNNIEILRTDGIE